MKNIINIVFVAVLSLAFASCNKEIATPYDHPFFYIHQNQSSAITVQSTRNETVEYKVYFSTKMQYDPIDLQYTINVGDGLKEGVDFEILTKNTVLTFKPGYFEMPIQIRWISNPVDATKNNSLTIQLGENNKGITVGLPGPDKLQSSLKITKI